MNKAIKQEILEYAERLPKTKGAQTDHEDFYPVRRLLEYLKKYPDQSVQIRLDAVIAELFRVGVDVSPGSEMLRRFGDLASYREDDPERIWREKAIAEGRVLIEQIETHVKSNEKERALEVLVTLGERYPEFAERDEFSKIKRRIEKLGIDAYAIVDAQVAVMNLHEDFSSYAHGFGEDD